MSTQIHNSIVNDDGYFVPSSWLYTMMGLIFVLVLSVITLVWMIYNNSVRVDTLSEFNDVVIERRKAMDEMLTNRAKVQEWTYQQACEYAKSKNKTCLDNPQWWADPMRYPKLADDVNGAGAGLLPKEK